MATITKPQINTSHWYDKQANPAHRVRGKNGKTRPTTLADAKKLGLFPSVTTILSIFAKPQLEKWKLQQVALAAFSTPDMEDQEKRVEKAIELAFAQVDRAADWGTEVHQALERFLRHGHPISPDLQVATQPVLDFLNPLKIEATEIRVVDEKVGFAGTTDLAFSYGEKIGILDFKTRKTIPGKPVHSYPFQAMQIAAYGGAFWSQKLDIPPEQIFDRMLGANLYISSTEPGRFDYIKYSGDQLKMEWATFVLACAIWRYLRGYDPRHPERVLILPETTKSISAPLPPQPPQEDLKIPTGKYKGKTLDEIPKEFLPKLLSYKTILKHDELSKLIRERIDQADSEKDHESKDDKEDDSRS